MEGYYQKTTDEKTEIPRSRLHISATNLQEFKQLIEKAQKEADRLNKTIDQLSNFDLVIDFTVSES